MTLADAEQAVKLLRKMCKSMNTGIVKGEDPQAYIAGVFKALGIMYTLQYRPLQKNTHLQISRQSLLIFLTTFNV